MSSHDCPDRIDLAASKLDGTPGQNGRYRWAGLTVAVMMVALATLSSSLFPWGARHPVFQLIMIGAFAAGFAILCLVRAAAEKSSRPKS